ncbi:MAG: hypothetical protein IJA67_15875 [Oscillospiraceae bacterium]|nr:hypothetical protein [Oscillospiraceae bacterium]
MKRISLLLTIIALILSHIMCFVVAWNYRDMLCGIEHSGFSAPADVAFLAAIPYAAGILLCGILAAIFRKKAK